MELNDKQRAIIVGLITFAWERGGITSPQMGHDVEDLRRIILQPAKEESK